MSKIISEGFRIVTSDCIKCYHAEEYCGDPDNYYICHQVDGELPLKGIHPDCPYPDYKETKSDEA